MEKIATCKKHGDTLHTLASDGRWRCKKCRVEAVQRRREKLKIDAITYKGGKCDICGYDGCPDVFEFHHLNPKEKEFSISKDGYCRSFDSIKNEIDKCVLLCCRCHREVHYLLRKDDSLTYKEIRNRMKNIKQ